MNRAIAIILFVAGLVNAYPLVGVLSGENLLALYGVTLEDPNLLILMRHRAVVFGLLGAFVMSAAFIPARRGLAIAAALMGMLSFIALAWTSGAYNDAIRRIIAIDLVLSLAVLMAAAMMLLQFANRGQRSGSSSGNRSTAANS